MTAAEVIAAAMHAETVVRMPDGYNSIVMHSDEEYARIALDALKAAGYAVVELPYPTDENLYDYGQTCSAAWLLMEDDEGERAVDVAVYGESVEVYIPTDENRFDPEAARVLATAILAAADAAEAVS